MTDDRRHASMTPMRTIDTAPLQRVLHLAGPAHAPALIGALLDDLKTTKSGLDLAWNGPDFAALRTKSHVLIGLAGTIGDSELQSLAEHLNATAHSQNNLDILQMKESTMVALDELINVMSRQPSGTGH